VIPDDSVVMGAPGKIVRQTDEAVATMLKYSAAHYVENWKRYAREMRPQA
jgi:carbonic anhydrase/acetyltransferase-like protein (isoleucine patch superfamily)